MNLKFEVNRNGSLPKKEKEALIEAYRVFLSSLYGNDLVDNFLSVTHLRTNQSRKKDVLKKFSENYKKALFIFEELETNPNNELLCIYDDKKNLIGGGRLHKMIGKEKGNASVLEIVFLEQERADARELWKQTIIEAESIFREKGYKKMYVEIPFKEGPLLIRANELGFTEDPKDIVVNNKVKTYLLNKKLKETKNE